MSWPRTTQEAAELTEEQFNYLMLGLNPLNPKIKDVDPKKIYWSLCKTEKFYASVFNDIYGLCDVFIAPTETLWSVISTLQKGKMNLLRK